MIWEYKPCTSNDSCEKISVSQPNLNEFIYLCFAIMAYQLCYDSILISSSFIVQNLYSNPCCWSQSLTGLMKTLNIPCNLIGSPLCIHIPVLSFKNLIAFLICTDVTKTSNQDIGWKIIHFCFPKILKD